MDTLKRWGLVALVVAFLIGGHVLNELRFANDKAEMNGVVESVEDISPNEAGFKQIAIVKLTDGSFVKARVLPGCIAFSGQKAHLFGGRSSYLGRSYVMTIE